MKNEPIKWDDLGAEAQAHVDQLVAEHGHPSRLSALVAALTYLYNTKVVGMTSPCQQCGGNGYLAVSYNPDTEGYNEMPCPKCGASVA